MTKKETSAEDLKDRVVLVLGYAKEQIREAYFKGKLNQLLADIQANQDVTAEGLAELEKILEEYQGQNKVVRTELAKKFSAEMGEEVKPPSVDELTGDDTDLTKWIADKDKVLEDVRGKMKAMRTRLAQPDFDIKELQDLAFELAFWRNWIVQDTIYKRQLWKQKLTRLIDDYEISRREAEDRSELTKEYRDYVMASEFQKSVEDLIISARKGYTE